MTNTISILGSTGSIGRQTLDVAEQLGLRVAALTANSNVERMEAQCRKFRPALAVMTDETAAKELAIRLADMPVKVLAGTAAACGQRALRHLPVPAGLPGEGRGQEDPSHLLRRTLLWTESGGIAACDKG